jgi:hypothetical protein
LHDIDGGYFEQLLMENIRNGIEYKYVVCVSDLDSSLRLDLLKKKYSSLKIIVLESNQYFNITYTDLAIYDPVGNVNQRKAFMEMPNSGLNFWVEVDASNTTKLVDQILRQVPELR